MSTPQKNSACDRIGLHNKLHGLVSRGVPSGPLADPGLPRQFGYAKLPNKNDPQRINAAEPDCAIFFLVAYG